MATPYAASIIAVWAVVTALTLPVTVTASIAAVILVLLLAVGRVRPALLGRLRMAAAEGLLLQAAVFVAGVNGIRGRWQVWDA
jgi:hypothetical protein